MFDKMVQKPQSLFIFFHPTIVTNGRDIGFFEVLLASLPDHLPATLTSLTMPVNYTGTLNLPENLQILNFPKNARFNSPLVLPNKIVSVQLPVGFNFAPDMSGCSFLQSFDVPPFIGVPLLLPDTLIVLKFHARFNNQLPNQWPRCLEELWFDSRSGHFNGGMPDFPKSIKIVSLSAAMVGLPKSLFDADINLEKLVLGTAFNNVFARPWRLNSLTELTFGDMFNHPIIDADRPSPFLPVTLKKLSFGRSFNQGLPVAALHTQLQELELGGDFTQDLADCKFPPTLTRLRFGAHFDRDIPSSSLPPSLKSLEVHLGFNRQKPCGNHRLKVTYWG